MSAWGVVEAFSRSGGLVRMESDANDGKWKNKVFLVVDLEWYDTSNAGDDIPLSERNRGINQAA